MVECLLKVILFRNGKDMACVTFDFQPTDEQLQYALDVLCDWN